MSDYHSKWQNDTNFRLSNPSPVTVDEINESIRNTVREKSSGSTGGFGALAVIVAVVCVIGWSIPYLAAAVDYFKGRPAPSSAPVAAPDQAAPTAVPSVDMNSPIAKSVDSTPPESTDATETAEPPSATTAEERETKAHGRLELALRLMKTGKVDAARRWLREIVEQYPGTKAGDEAQSQLQSMESR